MQESQVTFRPFVDVSAVYDTGLSGVGLTSSGQLANESSPGIQVAGGISGSHFWRHTQIGLEYHGDITEFQKATYFSNTTQMMMLGIKHQFTRHIYLNLRETAGTFSYGGGILPLDLATPFDASQSYVPVTDFFDNRTIYGTTQADLIIQKTARLSFDLGGDGFFNRRRSSALASIAGGTARADVQYRLTRRTTIGAEYTYNHFSFNHIFSSTDIHGAVGTYAVQLSRWLELTGFAGVMRVETKFVQDVPVDPVVTAILGIQESPQVVYSVRYVPNISGRLSRTFQHGIAYINASHTVTPGNGLFLTSTITDISAGYTYTGLRRWSFNLQGGYLGASSIGNVYGNYGGDNAIMSASRQVSRAVHVIASFNLRRYNSGNFALYNRTFYDAKIGIGFAPGDVPLRVW